MDLQLAAIKNGICARLFHNGLNKQISTNITGNKRCNMITKCV